MPTTQKPLILIVDDHPTNLQALAAVLKTEYRVKTATDGRTALDLAKHSEKPDLIVLDVMMPDMDGYEVCLDLKNTEETKDIPVIFLTAKGEIDYEERGLNLGAMDYITKPFSPLIVRARVRNHIALKQKTDLLESLASLDGLTGIPNRRRFDETLETEWKRALRGGTTLAIIMADIDFFKAYNDHYGHGAGDQCLKTVAQALSGALGRPSDVLARYGGEEFAAVIPDTGGPGARQLAEHCCASVTALGLPHGFSGAAAHVTISAGYAALQPAPGQAPKELLEMADKMLYQAKEQGRNRVCG